MYLWHNWNTEEVILEIRLGEAFLVTLKVFSLDPLLLPNPGRLVLCVQHEVVDVAADDARPELRRGHDQRSRSHERVDRDGPGIDGSLKEDEWVKR